VRERDIASTEGGSTYTHTTQREKKHSTLIKTMKKERERIENENFLLRETEKYRNKQE